MTSAHKQHDNAPKDNYVQNNILSEEKQFH